MFYSREWFCACFRSINQIDLGNQEVLMIAEGKMNFQLQYNLLVSVKWKNGVSKQKASLTIISVLPVYFILPQTNHWTLWIIAVISLAGGFCVSWPFTWWVEKGFTYVCTVCQVWGWKRKKKKKNITIVPNAVIVMSLLWQATGIWKIKMLCHPHGYSWNTHHVYRPSTVSTCSEWMESNAKEIYF